MKTSMTSTKSCPSVVQHTPDNNRIVIPRSDGKRFSSNKDLRQLQIPRPGHVAKSPSTVVIRPHTPSANPEQPVKVQKAVSTRPPFATLTRENLALHDSNLTRQSLLREDLMGNTGPLKDPIEATKNEKPTENLREMYEEYLKSLKPSQKPPSELDS